MDTAFESGDTRPHVFVGITDEDGLGGRERRVTFAVLLFSPVEALAQTGFAVAAGLLLDTFIVRTLVVPACAALFEDRSWWSHRRPTRPVRTAASPPSDAHP